MIDNFLCNVMPENVYSKICKHKDTKETRKNTILKFIANFVQTLGDFVLKLRFITFSTLNFQ